MAQKGLWNTARKRMLEDRGALPKEDGEFVRADKAIHEKAFLSSWLSEDTEGKAEKEMKKRAKEEKLRSEKREVG